MQTEYLIIFKSSENICTNEDKFRNLLSTHTEISFNKDNNNIKFKNNEFSLSIQTGKLPDESIYYDCILKTIDANTSELDFNEFLKVIRTICTKFSNQQIITLYNGIGEFYALKSYPIIYKTENLMRKLIYKFMIISAGYEWSKSTTPKDIRESIKTGKKDEVIHLLHEIDFIKLSDFLFTTYANNSAQDFLDSIKRQSPDLSIKIDELISYIPKSNWERFFKDKVQCDAEFIKSRWKKLYEIRCDIAHCRDITKEKFDDLVKLSDEINNVIEKALSSINQINIQENDREELLENISAEIREETLNYSESLKIKITTFLEQFNILHKSINKILFEKNLTKPTKFFGSAGVFFGVPSLRKGLEILAKEQIIKKDTYYLILKLQELRNKIAHGIFLDLTEQDLNNALTELSEIHKILQIDEK